MRPPVQQVARSNPIITESVSRSATANCPRRSSPQFAGADPISIPQSWWPTIGRRCTARLDDYIAAGLTKFVIRPAGDVSTTEFLEAFVTQLLPRQN